MDRIERGLSASLGTDSGASTTCRRKSWPAEMVDFRAIIEHAKLGADQNSGFTGFSGFTGENGNNVSDLESPAVKPLGVVTRSSVAQPSHPETSETTGTNPVVLEASAKKVSRTIALRPVKPLKPLKHLQAEPTREIRIGEDANRTLAIPLGSIPALYADTFFGVLAEPPADVPRERWHCCIRDAVEFVDRWGEKAARLGWSAEDLFGLHPAAPMAQYDRMGLLWMLKGEHVVALTAIGARLSGGLTYYRRGR
jgi:hypothetical protein